MAPQPELQLPEVERGLASHGPQRPCQFISYTLLETLQIKNKFF